MLFNEDPATGAAAAAFAGALPRFAPPGDGEHDVVIEQGYEMRRPNLITLSVTVQNRQLVGAAIGGEAVAVHRRHHRRLTDPSEASIR